MLMVVSNLVLAGFVIFQAIWAGVGLSAFCEDQATLLSAISEEKWTELAGDSPLPTPQVLVHSAHMYSGNRITRVILVAPPALIVQAFLCAWLLIRTRPTILSRP